VITGHFCVLLGPFLAQQAAELSSAGTGCRPEVACPPKATLRRPEGPGGHDAFDRVEDGRTDSERETPQPVDTSDLALRERETRNPRTLGPGATQGSLREDLTDIRGTIGVSPDAARLDIGQRLVLLGLAFFRTKLLTLESHTLAVSTSHSPGKQVHMKTCSSLPGAPDLNRPGLSFDHRRPQGYETNSRSLLRTSKFSATLVAQPQRGSLAFRVEHSLWPCWHPADATRPGAVDPRPRVFGYFRNGSRLTSFVRFHRSPSPR
jgi:hypothetical protein